MLTNARLIGYLTTGVGGLGVLLAAMGWIEFDPATGHTIVPPFNAYALAPIIAAPIMSLVAALAVIFKWGPSK